MRSRAFRRPATTAATSRRAPRARAARSTTAIAGSAVRSGPLLRAKGMLFAGLDVIGGFVTEINVTSPTGIRELDRQFGIDIAAKLIAAIGRKLRDTGRAAAGRR